MLSAAPKPCFPVHVCANISAILGDQTKLQKYSFQNERCYAASSMFFFYCQSKKPRGGCWKVWQVFLFSTAATALAVTELSLLQFTIIVRVMFAMGPENRPVTHSGWDSISIYTHKNDNCVCQKGKIANICVCNFIYLFLFKKTKQTSLKK